MKKSTILSVICILLIAISNISAQDSKIPGGDYSAPIGAEVRNGKLVFESQDGNFRWWIDSRIQLDGAMYFENKNQLSNGTYLRRLTFAVKSQLWKDWEAELEIGRAHV